MPEQFMDVEWADCRRHSISAACAYEELERIRAECGGLTAGIVLAHARDKASCLHGEFTWNDEVAGHRYRMAQAGALIRAIVVHRREVARPYRLYSLVRKPNETFERGTYQQTCVLMSDAETRVMLMTQAIRELAIFKAKYHTLIELGKLIDSTIDALQAG